MTVPDEEQHAERMQALVEFTATSFSTSQPSPFGSSIYEVASGRLVSQAYDTVMREFDPTNHGEMNAIREATRQLQRLSLRGYVLYSTCEPCPMCMSACIWSELDMVVYGASTLEDADRYWPQASDVTPQELVTRMRLETQCNLLAHVERAQCQELFEQCDQLRRQPDMKLPPNR